MGVEMFARRVVIVAGDSHSGTYDGLTCVHEASGVEFAAIAVNIHGRAKASKLMLGGGKALLMSKLAEATDQARAFSDAPPFVVLTLGGSDWFLESANPIWSTYDFVLPDEPALFDRSKGCIQFQLVSQWLEQRLAPYNLAFDRMESEGLKIAAVLPPPPPHRSTDKLRELLTAYHMLHFSVAPFPVRGKICWMTRRFLANLAARRRLPFIDTWQGVADGLFLPSEYEFDGIHVSRACAEIFLRLVCSQLIRLETGAQPLLHHAIA